MFPHNIKIERPLNGQMVSLFEKCCIKFIKMDRRCVKIQFKWTWMHFYLNNLKFTDESEFLNIMKLRLENEESVLRRIVEFDDIPYKYCVLGIISIDEESVNLFDGFYTLNAKIDTNIYNKLRGCTLGSVISVFGMELLINHPRSILDINKNDIVLKLHFNSIAIGDKGSKLGYIRNKISFKNSIRNILIQGGIVSALILKIEKIIESKFQVIIDNYRNVTDDLEKEKEKVMNLAKIANRTIKHEDVVIMRYTKLLVSDDTGECLLTWWKAPEDILKVGDVYKFVYLVPRTKSMGLHLTNTRKTYFKKIK